EGIALAWLDEEGLLEAWQFHVNAMELGYTFAGRADFRSRADAMFEFDIAQSRRRRRRIAGDEPFGRVGAVVRVLHGESHARRTFIWILDEGGVDRRPRVIADDVEADGVFQAKLFRQRMRDDLPILPGELKVRSDVVQVFAMEFGGVFVGFKPRQ